MLTINTFLKKKKLQLLPYQEETINTYLKHSNGIIQAPTGRGKTMAIALAIINDCIKQNKKPKILWVTPMRALVRDTATQLTALFEAFYSDIKIVLRTSDSTSYQKKKARDNQWNILLTTPESCALFTTYDDMLGSFEEIDAVIIDEWHVLVNQKRGILFELFLSWLSMYNKKLK